MAVDEQDAFFPWPTSRRRKEKRGLSPSLIRRAISLLLTTRKAREDRRKRELRHSLRSRQGRKELSSSLYVNSFLVLSSWRNGNPRAHTTSDLCAPFLARSVTGIQRRSPDFARYARDCNLARRIAWPGKRRLLAPTCLCTDRGAGEMRKPTTRGRPTAKPVHRLELPPREVARPRSRHVRHALRAERGRLRGSLSGLVNLVGPCFCRELEGARGRQSGLLL